VRSFFFFFLPLRRSGGGVPGSPPLFFFSGQGAMLTLAAAWCPFPLPPFFFFFFFIGRRGPRGALAFFFFFQVQSRLDLKYGSFASCPEAAETRSPFPSPLFPPSLIPLRSLLIQLWSFFGRSIDGCVAARTVLFFPRPAHRKGQRRLGRCLVISFLFSFPRREAELTAGVFLFFLPPYLRDCLFFFLVWHASFR